MITPPISMPNCYVGQTQAEQTFLNLYNHRRMPHAFLLTGPQGVGKCALAFRMARALLDNAPVPLQSLDFDMDTKLSKQIHDVSHPDLRFLYKGYISDGAENVSGMIKTDDIRNAIGFTMMTPSDSNHRILIVNDCHMIASNGQNALLKTLEEPGTHTTIILTTHMPQLILTTIKSRCVTISLNMLSETDIMGILQQKFPDMDTAQIESYAKIANGSIGDAVLYVESDALTVYHNLMESLYQGTDAVYTLAGSVNNKKQPHLFDILYKLWQYFSNKIVRTHAQTLPLPAVIQSEYNAYAYVTAKYPQNKLLDWVHMITQALQDTAPPVYLDKKLVVLTAFLPLHT